MVFIKLREGEAVDEALRRFKRECERNGIFREFKRRQHYAPPSVRRKLKAAEARRKMSKMRRARSRRPSV
jgi:small subunit ribosomal protein S21